MRTSPDRRRRRRGGRFARERTGWGGPKLIRFRRNRELMAREITTLVLWLTLSGMLLVLARRLWDVSRKHLADSEPLVQFALPALAILASIGSFWRARRNWAELQDIRREQAELVARLQDPEDVSNPSN
ncbi:MAG: hypothetical protein HKO53_10245 [Gemmatimonadetes bacterium]|nr:hypothetical protein [Gemmatimonadota bacterium]